MLNILRGHLKSNLLFFENELGKLDYSCCPNSKIKVVDFDKVKDVYSDKIGIPELDKLKSVDAIFFESASGTLHLIEMKCYNPSGGLSLNDFMKERFDDLCSKTIDSILILLSIMGYFQIDKSFYAYFLNPKKLRIKSILLTDLKDRDLLSLQIANLGKVGFNVSKRIPSDLVAINCKDFERRYSQLK